MATDTTQKQPVKAPKKAPLKPASGNSGSLGKGLAATLKNATSSQRIIKIPVDKIVQNPNNPRKKFDAKKIKELASMIKAAGENDTPIKVFEIGGGRYMIHYGQRRLAATILAGLPEINATVIAKMSDENELISQLVENTGSEPMTTSDIVAAVAKLLETKKATELTAPLAVSASWISKVRAISTAGKSTQSVLSDSGINDIEALYNLAQIEKEDAKKAESLAAKWVSGNSENARQESVAAVKLLKESKSEKGNSEKSDTKPKKPTKDKKPAAESSVSLKAKKVYMGNKYLKVVASDGAEYLFNVSQAGDYETLDESSYD